MLQNPFENSKTGGFLSRLPSGGTFGSCTCSPEGECYKRANRVVIQILSLCVFCF
jgi:hypothetical protein